jgi:hypothetical protein
MTLGSGRKCAQQTHNIKNYKCSPASRPSA